ncbi:MAG: uncharacterized protein A8A55_1779 [Amphiamblys sp. WSBS2006]|nr:MAG: uncharacterized protein A8A55_1779 [Amphiamblys sp. WSBS2006]
MMKEMLFFCSVLCAETVNGLSRVATETETVEALPMPPISLFGINGVKENKIAPSEVKRTPSTIKQFPAYMISNEEKLMPIGNEIMVEGVSDIGNKVGDVNMKMGDFRIDGLNMKQGDLAGLIDVDVNKNERTDATEGTFAAEKTDTTERIDTTERTDATKEIDEIKAKLIGLFHELLRKKAIRGRTFGSDMMKEGIESIKQGVSEENRSRIDRITDSLIKSVMEEDVKEGYESEMAGEGVGKGLGEGNLAKISRIIEILLKQVMEEDVTEEVAEEIASRRPRKGWSSSSWDSSWDSRRRPRRRPCYTPPNQRYSSSKSWKHSRSRSNRRRH